MSSTNTLTKNLVITNCPNIEIAYKNVVALSIDDFNNFNEFSNNLHNKCFVKINHLIFEIIKSHSIRNGYIGLNKIIRGNLNKTLSDTITVSLCNNIEQIPLIEKLHLSIDTLFAGGIIHQAINISNIITTIHELFNKQIWKIGQQILIPIHEYNLFIVVVNINNNNSSELYGLLNENTEIYIEKPNYSQLQLIN